MVEISKIKRLFLSILLAFITSSPTFAAPSGFDFAKPSEFADVKISPNGRYLAANLQSTELRCIDDFGFPVEEVKADCEINERAYWTQSHVIIYDLVDDVIIRRLPVPDSFYIAWLDWASDDRFLIGMSKPTTLGYHGQRILWGGSRVLSVPLMEANYVALFEEEKSIAKENRYLSRVTNMLRNDPEHVNMPARRSGDLDLWKVNVLDGSADRIARGKEGTFFWFTDPAGNPTMRFDCKRSCKRVDVFAPELGDDKWKKIKSFKVRPDEDDDDFDFWPIGPAEKEGQYYVFSNEDEDTQRSIKIYDLTTETFVNTVFKHPKYDVGGAFLELETGAYGGAFYVGDRLQYVLLDEGQQQSIDALNAFFKNRQNVRIMGFDSSGDRAIVYVTSPANPGEYYIYDRCKQTADLLFSRQPVLDGALNTNADVLEIPTRDGKFVTAYHTYPKSGAKGAPLIVMPHGGPEARDYYNYSSDVQYFATRGYQVLQVNFRGSSGYGEWGGVMQNDVTDAVKYIQRQDLASPENTCIVGYSYGGYAALYGGASTPELYECVVAGGGVSDILLDILKTGYDHGLDSETYEYWLKSMGHPSRDKERLKAVSPVNLADNFTAPVLLLHGTSDKIVHFEQSEEMKEALEKAGKSVELIELVGEGHRDWGIKTRTLYWESIEAFLKQHIGP